MSARDAQFAGKFSQPVRLAESMRTDDAIFVALENRLAPAQMIGVEIVPPRKGRAESIAAEAEALFGTDGLAIPSDAISSIRADYVDHGVGVGVLHWTPRKDGTRVDVQLQHWPLEFVWWDTSTRCLMTRLHLSSDQPMMTPILHGDGRWVVFSKNATMPWRKQACLLPACMVWARHAFAGRDWAKGSASQGNAKVIGELPEGVSLQVQDEDGNVTTSSEAAEFAELLVDIASLDTPVGIKPHGSTIDYLTNSSKAWEVWKELMANAEKSAARIYLGSDAILGSQGGAPGIDVEALFGVSRTRVEGDLACDQVAIRTGLIEPWTAVNFGDSTLTPDRVPLVPDSDADAERRSFAERSEAFWRDVQSALSSGSALNREWVEELADRYSVPIPATLGVQADSENENISLPLAPTDIAKVVRVREARAAQGLPPFGDERDDMTISELENLKEAAAPIEAPLAEHTMSARRAPAEPETLLRSALEYARLGWPVFPQHTPTPDGGCSCGQDCDYPGKHPRIKGGSTQATTVEAPIRAWWTRWPSANIGCVAGNRSGLLIVDIDPKNGGDVTWQRIVSKYGEPPPTVTADTGTGGWHLYYLRPETDAHIRSQNNAIDPGVDTRCDGGAFTLPPSLHVSGRQYAFREGLGPDEVEAQPIPEWLFGLMYPHIDINGVKSANPNQPHERETTPT